MKFSNRFPRLFLFLIILLAAALPAVAQQGPISDEDAAGLACAGCAGVMLLIPILVLVASILIGLWMYRDAQKRNDPNAVVWLIIGILFNIVGIIIYIVVRKNQNAGPPPPPTPYA
jgi:hypothetical protein